MTAHDDEPTDPGGSDPPPQRSLAEELGDAVRNAIAGELGRFVDVQLVQQTRMNRLASRVRRVEATRLVLPISIALAALLIATVTLARAGW